MCTAPDDAAKEALEGDKLKFKQYNNALTVAYKFVAMQVRETIKLNVIRVPWYRIKHDDVLFLFFCG